MNNATTGCAWCTRGGPLSPCDDRCEARTYDLPAHAIYGESVCESGMRWQAWVVLPAGHPWLDGSPDTIEVVDGTAYQHQVDERTLVLSATVAALVAQGWDRDEADDEAVRLWSEAGGVAPTVPAREVA